MPAASQNLSFPTAHTPLPPHPTPPLKGARYAGDCWYWPVTQLGQDPGPKGESPREGDVPNGCGANTNVLHTRLASLLGVIRVVSSLCRGDQLYTLCLSKCFTNTPPAPPLSLSLTKKQNSLVQNELQTFHRCHLRPENGAFDLRDGKSLSWQLHVNKLGLHIGIKPSQSSRDPRGNHPCAASRRSLHEWDDHALQILPSSTDQEGCYNIRDLEQQTALFQACAAQLVHSI